MRSSLPGRRTTFGDSGNAMTSRKSMTIGLMLLILLGSSAPDRLAAADLDALLVRQTTHDILVLRPWLNDPPPAGLKASTSG